MISSAVKRLHFSMMGPSEKLHQGQFRKKVLGMKNGFLHLHSTCLFVFRLNGKSCFCFLLIEVSFSFDDGGINHLKLLFLLVNFVFVLEVGYISFNDLL